MIGDTVAPPQLRAVLARRDGAHRVACEGDEDACAEIVGFGDAAGDHIVLRGCEAAGAKEAFAARPAVVSTVAQSTRPLAVGRGARWKRHTMCA